MGRWVGCHGRRLPRGHRLPALGQGAGHHDRDADHREHVPGHREAHVLLRQGHPRAEPRRGRRRGRRGRRGGCRRRAVRELAGGQVRADTPGRADGRGQGAGEPSGPSPLTLVPLVKPPNSSDITMRMTTMAISQIRQPMSLGLRGPSRRPYHLSMSPPAGRASHWARSRRYPGARESFTAARVVSGRAPGPRDKRRAAMLRIRTTGGLVSKLAVLAAALVAVAVLAIALSAVHLLPRLRNPFAEQTTVTSGPVLLKSITALSRYEAASGPFQVVVDLSQHSLLPSFLQGSETLFIGQGTDIAFIDFSHL